MSQLALDLDLTPDVIDGVPINAEWPGWSTKPCDWFGPSHILRTDRLRGFVFVAGGWCDPDSEWAARYGLAWCCCVAAAALMLRGAP